MKHVIGIIETNKSAPALTAPVLHIPFGVKACNPNIGWHGLSAMCCQIVATLNTKATLLH